MAQVELQTASINNHTYTPPRLPDCLSGAHSLKPIVGPPSNEDVKAIHAAIRGLHGILAAPALYDPDLPMQLAQHLFEVQMAVYRSTYSFSLIPAEATYTPPKLPSHIPIPLEPVIGAPSDEDIRLAQNAVRMMDSLSTSMSRPGSDEDEELTSPDPYVFDPDLSANLSQHLFNIQAARYIQHSIHGQFTSPKPNHRRTHTSNEIEHISSREQASDTPESVDPTHSTAEQHPHNQSQTNLQPNVTGETKCASDDANQLLDVLKNINNVLISTQQHFAQSTSDPDCYAIMNLKGELPSKYDLPRLRIGSKSPSSGRGLYACMGYCNSGSALSDLHLASYLRFYDIGAGLFQENDGEPRIAPDKIDEAAKLLYKHLEENPGSGWAVSL